MIISSRERLAKIYDDPNLSLDSTDINRVMQAKTLDIVTDEKLPWKNQIDEITTNVHRGIGMLTKAHIPQETLRTVYTVY